MESSRYHGNRQRTPSPWQLSWASRQSSPGPLWSPRQPVPVLVNHQPFPRHSGNCRQTHRPLDTLSCSCPQASSPWTSAPPSVRPFPGPQTVSFTPTLAGGLGSSHCPVLRLLQPQPVSPLSLLRGTVHPPQGALQNASHVPPPPPPVPHFP